MASTEIEGATLSLAACGAWRTHPTWPRADLSLRPVLSSSGTRRLVQLALGGVRPFPLAAQFLQASTYGSEVVGSAGSAHVSSRSFLVEFWWRSGPRALRAARVRRLILGRKAQALSAHRALDETLAHYTG
jgi:hypothetical protein